MFYKVTPLRPLSKELTYFSDKNIEIGTKVKVPLGTATCFGYVTDIAEEIKDAKIIEEIFYKTFSKDNLKFYKWVSLYYHYPLGELLSLVTPSYLPKTKKTEIHEFKNNKKNIKNKNKEKSEHTKIKIDGPIHDLTEEQKLSLEKIRNSKKEVSLLHGVTGSGKTEVYIEIIKDFMRKGKSALILVPEIALTPQLVSRFKNHFEGEISVIHSGISPKKRYETWMNLSKGLSKLCIGARSAIFSPIKDLGLIIVDEEQDDSYKQNDRLRYNTRDLAFVLSKINNSKVILSTATPSIESLYKAKNDEYEYIRISKRIKNYDIPRTIIVDLKKEKNILSKVLIEKIKETLRKKQQVILYINRRGISKTILCKDCGEKFLCKNCSISLTEHKNKLLCHYCGYSRKIPDYCNKCGSDNLISYGVGVEKVIKEVKELFPNAKVIKMDSDSVDSKRKLDEALNKINKKEVDIIIGTQILIKGHDFEGVSLVGVVNIDYNLELPDFRSPERAFQHIIQVSGRAGRRGETGLVVLQTYNPDNIFINYAINSDFESFLEEELKNRSEVLYPPFINLVDLKLSSKEKTYLNEKTEEVFNFIDKVIKNKKIEVDILGPAPCPIEIINNRYRNHILLKGKSKGELNNLVNILNKNIKRDKKVRISIDVDPYSIF